MMNPVFEIPYHYDRLQDKFQLPDFVRLFSFIKSYLDTTDFNPPVVGLAHGYLLRSSNKIIADYIVSMPGPDELTPNDAISQINLIVEASFIRKWQQLRDAFYTAYNPLSPLDYVDERTVNRTEEKSGVSTKNASLSTIDAAEHSGVETNVSNGEHSETISRSNLKTREMSLDAQGTEDSAQTQSNTRTGSSGESGSRTSSGERDEGRFGFNASVVSPVTSADTASNESTLRDTNANESSAQMASSLNSHNEAQRQTGSDSETGNDTHELRNSDSGTLSRSGSDSRLSDRTENSSGTAQEAGNLNENVVTRRSGRYLETPQELLEKELKARRRNLVDIIYQDLDSILCVPVY